jgi:hypothetical protein
VRSTTTFAHAAIGRIGRPASLRPLIGGQGKFWQASGISGREIAKLRRAAV